MRDGFEVRARHRGVERVIWKTHGVDFDVDAVRICQVERFLLFNCKKKSCKTDTWRLAVRLKDGEFVRKPVSVGVDKARVVRQCDAKHSDQPESIRKTARLVLP